MSEVARLFFEQGAISLPDESYYTQERFAGAPAVRLANGVLMPLLGLLRSRNEAISELDVAIYAVPRARPAQVPAQHQHQQRSADHRHDAGGDVDGLGLHAWAARDRGAERVAHSELGDHRLGDVGCALQIVRCAPATPS